MSVTFYPNYCHYKGFDAAAEPTITGQGFISSGGETTGTAYDLLDSKRTSLITIDTDGENTEFEIDFDLTTNLVNPTFYIIDNHNLDSAHASLLFEIAGTPTSEISAGYNGTLGSAMSLATNTDGLITATENGILLVIMTPTMNENNFEINIDSTVFAADVTMGEVAVGVSFTPTFSPNINQPLGYANGSSINESDGGKRYGFKKSGHRRNWKLTWDYMSAANKTSLETVHLVTDGVKYPFWINLGETAAATPTLHFVRFMSPRLDFVQKTANAYSISIDIEEEL